MVRKARIVFLFYQQVPYVQETRTFLHHTYMPSAKQQKRLLYLQNFIQTMILSTSSPYTAATIAFATTITTATTATTTVIIAAVPTTRPGYTAVPPGHLSRE